MLGLDVGTGSVKCVAASLEGDALWSSSIRYEHQSPQPGWAEQDAQSWWQASVQAVREVLGKHPELRERIGAIGVCGQGAAAVLLDSEWQPTRPAILWLDSRCATEAQHLAEECGPEIAAISGKLPAAYNVEPKLRWVEAHERAVWKRTKRCMTTTAYVTHQLCGAPLMNHSDAGILLSYDLRQRGWSARAAALMKIPIDLFGEIAECNEVIGGLTAEAARETGLPPGVPVIAGGEDTSAAALAAGVVSTDSGILSLGTAGTIYTPCPYPATDPRLLSFPHVLRGQTLVGGSTICGGSGLEWVARLIGKDSTSETVEALCREASQATAEHTRTVFLPYLSGELQPVNDGFARGVFFGVDFSTSPLDMVNAVMQGTAFAFAQNLEIAHEFGCGPSALSATGRPAQNEAFMQIVADATELPIEVLVDGGGAALGVAILAATAVDPAISAAEMSRRFTRVGYTRTPRRERCQRLAELFGVYKELYPRLRDLFPRLQSCATSYRCAEAS